MNWIKRLFGGNTKQEEAPVELAPLAPKTVAPTELARAFANQIPGALFEDFLADFRDDDLVARVTYTHLGVESRLLILWHRERGDGTTDVWLQTRAIGKSGYFDVRRCAAGEEFDDDEPRIFLTATCYLNGPRVRNEVARTLSLPESARERLFAASGEVFLVGLHEELMQAYLGDAFDFDALLRTRENAVAFLVDLGNELSFLGSQLPLVCKETAEFIESRTCQFCRCSFLFSPTIQGCTHCGAPAEGAEPMPPTQYAPLRDDPRLEDPEKIENTMNELRDDLQQLLPLLDEPVVREDPERGRLYVEYKIDGRPFRVKMMDTYVGVRAEATGARGDFAIVYRSETNDCDDPRHVWRESERRVFFSKHCSVRSDHTAKEAARIASLPAEARAKLLAMCEKYEGGAQLDDEGYLAQAMDTYAHFEGMHHVVECSRALASIADAIPRDYTGTEDQRYKLTLCGYCRWEYFAELNQTMCSHCGAEQAKKSTAA